MAFRMFVEGQIGVLDFALSMRNPLGRFTLGSFKEEEARVIIFYRPRSAAVVLGER